MFVLILDRFIFYNARSQHSIFDEVLEADEHHDLDRESDLAKPKYTFTECIVALILSLVLVTLLAVFLVERIEDVVESGVPDQFLGLILLPLVEKAAEHLTAVDEAWDGQMVSPNYTTPDQSIPFYFLSFLELGVKRLIE